MNTFANQIVPMHETQRVRAETTREHSTGWSGTHPPQVATEVTTFDTFYRAQYGKIASALSVSLGSAELGREAADEAMTRAYGRWSTVSAYSNPAGWVYRVGLNWGRSWHRTALRRANILSRNQPRPLDLSTPAATDDVDLRRAMTKLDPKLRGVVVCRYLLDWSTDQTAEALQLRPGTVKSRLRTALERLRVELSDQNTTTAFPHEVAR